MPLLLIAICLASCTPRQHDQRDVNRLLDYSDMGAAEDAGRTPDSTPDRPKAGGVK